MPNIPAKSHARTAAEFRVEVVDELKRRQSQLAREFDMPNKSRKAKALANEKLLLLQALIIHFSTVGLLP